MLKAPLFPLDKSDVFVCEFHNASGHLVAVCPIYVVGVEQTATGASIRVARGGVADQFIVTGVTAREIIDRLRRAYLVMQESFLAAFLRNDLGQLEDRVMGRVQKQLTGAVESIEAGLDGQIRSTVEHQLIAMGTDDSVPPPAESTTPKTSKKK